MKVSSSVPTVSTGPATRDGAGAGKTLAGGPASGVILVITLIMLSVVTIMLVLFLGISQRERASVTVASDRISAEHMASAALARAQSEVVSRMVASSNRFNYDLAVSVNFLNPDKAHFADGDTFDADNEDYDPYNVSYYANQNRAPLTPEQQAVNLGNLLYDPRPPVYVREPGGQRMNFRYYLDFNRNGRFEPTGLLPERISRLRQARTQNGDLLYTQLVGDPQWIGVLEHPGRPHSPTNRFIGRFAYLIMPEGKSLDLNAIYNRTKSSGYRRHQGVGHWELNLHAFLSDLHHPYWGNAPSRAHEDAASLFNYRLIGDWPFNTEPVPGFEAVIPVSDALLHWLGGDGNDFFADGPYLEGGSWLPPALDNDVVAVRNGNPYWGADLNHAYHDVQQLFPDDVPTMAKSGGALTGLDRLRWQMNSQGTNWNTYDRYLVYRMIAQLGVDSEVDDQAQTMSLATWDQLEAEVSVPWQKTPKLNLNLDRQLVDGQTNYVAWEPRKLFLAAADRLLQARLELRPPDVAATTNAATVTAAIDGREHFTLAGTYMTNLPPSHPLTEFSVTNVGLQVWPQVRPDRPQYSAGVHQLLQQAANITDSATGLARSNQFQFAAAEPQSFPLVFRPRFSGLTNGTVRIIDYVAVTNDTSDQLRRPWRDLDTEPDRFRLQADDNVWGVPWVVSAKKGLPNFNEFGVLTVLEMTRKLEINKGAYNAGPPWQTNQMVSLSVSNLFGLELWNSYRRDYPRPLQIHALVDSTLTITNDRQMTLVSNRHYLPVSFGTNPAAARPEERWQGGRFQMPIYHNDTSLVLPYNGRLVRAANAVYHHAQGRLIPITDRQLTDIATVFPDDPGFRVGRLGLTMTNRVRCVMLDPVLGRIVDFVNLDDLVTHVDITEELMGQYRQGGEIGQFWSTNRWGTTNVFAPTEGVLKQIVTALGDDPISNQYWNSYAGRGAGRDREESIDLFRTFLGYPARYLSLRSLQDAYNRLPDPRKSFRRQVPFSPTVRKVVYQSLQANDPLVHYTVEDLTDLERLSTQKLFLLPGEESRLENVHNLGEPDDQGRGQGEVNRRYRPWPATVSESPQQYNLAHKDPLIRSSDDWRFPDRGFPNIGWLGRVHRGTPWQTIYLKAYLGSDDEITPGAAGGDRSLNLLALTDLPPDNTLPPIQGGSSYPFRTEAIDPDTGEIVEAADRGGLLATRRSRRLDTALTRWSRWSGSSDTHPTNDWRILDFFTIALNDNASKGLLSVNQTGLAAWSAALAGVTVQTNASSRDISLRDLDGLGEPRYGALKIPTAGSTGIPAIRLQGEASPLTRIVEGADGINEARRRFPGGRFTRLGDVLSAPALTVRSPFLNWTNAVAVRAGMDDAAVERIPQQVLSLLKADEPRVAIYAWGQSLSPADQSLRTDPTPYRLFNICTNYQVTGEYVVKRVVRFDGPVPALETRVESEFVLPTD